MSLTPHFDLLASLQPSPTPSPIAIPGYTRNSSSSESSSRSVMPVNISRPQENMLAAPDATYKATCATLKRKRGSQQPKKLRSKLTGLSTPFYVDTWRRPQGFFPTIKLPSRTVKSKTKVPHYITGVGTGDAKSGAAMPSLLTPDVPTSGSSLGSSRAMTAPSYLQSQPAGRKGAIWISDGSPSPPVGFPVRDEPFSVCATSSKDGVAYREGPTLTGFRQRHGNDVSIHDLSGASQINLMSECLDEDLGSPVESDDGMSDISSNSERQQYIDMHVSNPEDNHSLEEGGEAYDIVMQDNDTDEGCYDLGGGDGSSGCETGDSEGDSTSTSSHGATSRKGLLSSLARDIKRIGKQRQDAPCTKGDIQMVLDHLHSVVKLEKNETTHKETSPIPIHIPRKRSAPSLPTIRRTNKKRFKKRVQRIRSLSCQCNSRPSDSEVLVKSKRPVAYLKVRFVTNST